MTTDGFALAAAALVHVPQVVQADGQVTIVEVVDDIALVLARTTRPGSRSEAPG